MLFSAYLWIIILVAVIALVAVRQLMARRSRENLRLLIVDKHFGGRKSQLESKEQIQNGDNNDSLDSYCLI